MAAISAIISSPPPSLHAALLVEGFGEALDDVVDDIGLDEAVSEVVDGVPEEAFVEVADDPNEAVDDVVDDIGLDEAVSEVFDGVPEEVFADVADDPNETVEEDVGTVSAISELKLARLAFSFSTAPSLFSTVFVAFSFSGSHISSILRCANVPPCSPRVHLSSSVTSRNETTAAACHSVILPSRGLAGGLMTPAMRTLQLEQS